MAQITEPVILNKTGEAINETLKKMNYNEREIDATYASKIEAGKIDGLFEEWWAVADDGNYTKTQLLSRWFKLMKDPKVYGVKTYNYADSVSSDGELTDDSIALGKCTPATETSEGVDNFVKQPAFWIKEINYEIDANGEIEVKAVQGVDDSFSRDGHEGMVGVAQKSAFYQEYNNGTYNILKYSCARLSGFKPLPECVSPVDNSIRPFMVHAKYMGGIDSNGKPTSASGLAPMIFDVSHNSQISKWRARGANYAGISALDLKFRETMFRLKYARKGNSGLMEGCTQYYYDYTIAVAEENVERVILTKANANNLVVDSWLNIGTASRSASNTVKLAKIVAIKDVTIDDVVYSAVYVDNKGVKFTTDVTWHVCTMPWGSGSCDNVKGADGSPNLTNGKYPYIIQGIETQAGFYAVAADLIANKTYADGIQTIVPKLVRLAKNIATSVTANYYDGKESVLSIPSANWYYIQDVNEGEVLSPRAVGGGAGSSNGYRSALYDDASSGLREWFAWGCLHYGGACGLACVVLGDGLSSASWAVGSGAPGSAANRGEWS